MTSLSLAKIALAVVLIFSLPLMVQAQDLPSETRCTDGVDRDGDGLADDEDGGCVAPYFTDDSESWIYNTDMAWIFSGSDDFSQGPSVFQSGELVKDGNSYTDYSTSSNEILKHFVRNTKSSTWGGGSFDTKEQSSSGATVHREDDRLKDDPYSGQCGDGVGTESRSECPRDSGLPETDSVYTYTSSSYLEWSHSSTEGKLCDQSGGASGCDLVTTYSYSDLDGLTKYNFDNNNGIKLTSSHPLYGEPRSPRHDEILRAEPQEEIYKIAQLSDLIDYQAYEKTGETELYTSIKSNSVDCEGLDSCIKQECSLSDPVQTYDNETIEKNVDWKLGIPGDGLGNGGQEIDVNSVSSSTEVISYHVEGSEYNSSGSCTQTETDESSFENETGFNTDTFVTDDDRSPIDPGFYTELIDMNYIYTDVNSGYSSEVENEVSSGRSVRDIAGGYAIGGGPSDKLIGNSPSEGFTEFSAIRPDNSWASEQVDMIPASDSIMNPSGQDGQRSGFVAIREDTSGNPEVVGTNGVNVGSGFNPPSCSGDYYKCVAAVEPYVYNQNVEYRVEGPYHTSESLDVCMAYKRMTGDDNLYCLHTSSGAPHPGPGACGDIRGERWGQVRGPDVNTAGLENNPRHYETCMDQVEESQCVVGNGSEIARTVPEGEVMNLAPYYNDWNFPDYNYSIDDDYQRGGDAPDRSVCLDMDESSFEGEWYNLDNPEINDYLRENDISLVLDKSGNVNHGEIEGAEWIARGDGNYSLDFNNETGDRVNLDGKSPVGRTANFSFSAWVNPDESGQWILGEEDAFRLGYGFSGDQITFEVTETSGPSYNVSGGSLSQGSWHHVAGTYDSATEQQKLFIDGTEVASSNRNIDTIGNNLDNLCIGEMYCGSDKFFDGKLDDFRLFNSTLTNSEIQSLSNDRYNELGDENGFWPMNNGDDGLGLSPNQRVGSSDRIDYYYGKSPGPHHDAYNPRGNQYGTSLIADCGPLMTGCGNNGSSIRGAPSTTSTGEGTYFAFFENNATITEYNPVGEHSLSYVEPLFDGQVNKIKAMEGDSRYDSQLGTDHPDTSQFNANWFEDTRIDANESVQYAYTKYMNWSIASSGVPYPPFGAEQTGYGGSNGAHYRVDYSGENRTSIENESVPKTAKAFGNSLAVIAQKDIPSSDISKGEGFWIDPDDVKDHWQDDRINSSMKGASSWRDLITFDLDITGPDSGIGYDLEEGGQSSSNPGYVNEVRSTVTTENDTVFADIYWRRNSPLAEGLEPPVCGDDSNEYLLEEQGESVNSIEGDGKYACTTTPDQCVSYQSEDQRLYDIGEYHQAGEPGEEDGRLKDDDEVCDVRDNPVDEERGTWYDQDFAKEYCRANGLYGPAGVQWVNSNYVDNYPNAVNEGIDDDLNPYLEQQGVTTLESNPETYETEGGTPVTAGEPDSEPDPKVVTRGFCAGDDASEYIIVQDCRTDLCETDNSKIGVAEDPDKCLLDQSEINGVSGDERDIYQEGEKVEVDSEVMACFGGEWWDEWPVQFLRDRAEAPMGETDRVAFTVINPRQNKKTFNLELEFEQTDSGQTLDSRTFFEETGTNRMKLTVDPSTSSIKNIVINAEGIRNEVSISDVTISATSRDGNLAGTDTAKIGISNITGSSATTPSNQEQKEVPGIAWIQFIMIISLASVFYFNSIDAVF